MTSRLERDKALARMLLHQNPRWTELSWGTEREKFQQLVQAVLDMTPVVERAQTIQPEALRTIRDNGFVFDDIGKEPGNWQHLAFTLYNLICEMDTLADYEERER
jgi:hypothetical protein